MCDALGLPRWEPRDPCDEWYLAGHLTGAVHDRLLTRGAGGGGALRAARNPYGRHGSPAHRAKVIQRAEELKQQGYKITGGGGGREVAVPLKEAEKNRVVFLISPLKAQMGVDTMRISISLREQVGYPSEK